MTSTSNNINRRGQGRGRGSSSGRSPTSGSGRGRSPTSGSGRGRSPMRVPMPGRSPARVPSRGRSPTSGSSRGRSPMRRGFSSFPALGGGTVTVPSFFNSAHSTGIGNFLRAGGGGGGGGGGGEVHAIMLAVFMLSTLCRVSVNETFLQSVSEAVLLKEDTEVADRSLATEGFVWTLVLTICSLIFMLSWRAFCALTGVRFYGDVWVISYMSIWIAPTHDLETGLLLLGFLLVQVICHLLDGSAGSRIGNAMVPIQSTYFCRIVIRMLAVRTGLTLLSRQWVPWQGLAVVVTICTEVASYLIQRLEDDSEDNL
jgi:hypothetical protein